MAYFVIGQTYNVFENKGLFINANGMLATSENKTPEGIITPEMACTYLGKKVEGFQGKDCFQLADGRKFVGHRNHFDPTASYNTAKAKKAEAAGEEKASIQIPAADRVAELEKALEAAKQQAALEAEAEANIPEDGDEQSETVENPGEATDEMMLLENVASILPESGDEVSEESEENIEEEGEESDDLEDEDEDDYGDEDELNSDEE